MTFKAQFEGGFCPAECGNRIHEGDLIEKVDGEYVHANCAPQPDPFTLRPSEIVCGVCWTAPCRCIE